MPPKTSWTEIAILFVVVCIVGLVRWLARFLVRSKPELLENQLRDERGSLTIEELERISFCFNRSFVCLALCTLPFLGLWLGSTNASLMRDRGHKIFPWFIMVGPGLFCVLGLLCERFRFKLLKRKVARKALEWSEANISPSETQQAPGSDDNPFSPPRY